MRATSGKFVGLFSICLLLFSLAVPVIACPPPDCPDCHHWDSGKGWCVRDCDTGEICCNDSCCDNLTCCDDTTCCCPSDGCGDCEYCSCASCGCKCQEVTINCLYSCCELVGVNCAFTVGGVTTQSCVNQIVWSAPEGDPSSQEGGDFFFTRWDTSGTYTVTATTLCDSATKTMHICDPDLCEDCNSTTGECDYQCDPDECEVCNGIGFCVTRCDWAKCEECDGNGSCVSKCNSCQDCVAGVCLDCCPRCGPLCGYTTPGLSDGCDHPVDSYACIHEGGECYWEVTESPSRNDTCKCCTLDSTYCAKVRPWLCYNCVCWMPFPTFCCCCDDSRVGGEVSVGIRYVCP